MRRNRSSLASDLGFLGFLVLMFICVVFIAGSGSGYMQNIIILNIAFLLALVTYFTTVTAGLTLNLAFIFIYGLFTVYQTVSRGETIGVSTYFWLVMVPLITVMLWIFTSSSRELQAENERLKKTTANLATVDENTDLRNSVAFQKDASLFTGISTRYGIPLTLLVVKVKYWSEIRRLIPEEQLSEAIYDVSQLSQSSIRTNDALYLLDKDDATWGLLLFTDHDGARIVIERIKLKLQQLNENEFSGKYKVNLGLKIGAVQYDAAAIENPLDFIVQAKKQLEYDV
ncbi:diguanylate cyclase domain-containing protein [Paenibacillus typhae]|uniref:GGDEF domain-containing protein, diguanylate cyclase (C-di-GMP synthetase) or its enzymatically inactive variants n=1 Tax=Paenibacillus typhae TaxID=1174501 RepID=A0A1G8U6Z5_9BACL|nr:diguanylate cyclase [Paenibacillus typhae]SDJ49586.1 GGDEF domain-containing protein, diguanylate cyclase (c-di-GMP synthetase) or its enzymatically inactive variants [Paenibacillus typhae]